MVLTSELPAVAQFLNGRRVGPIGMAEEKDAATAAAEETLISDGYSQHEAHGRIVEQMQPSPGLPPRAAEQRRKDRVVQLLHTYPPATQQAVVESLTDDDRRRYGMAANDITAPMTAAYPPTAVYPPMPVYPPVPPMSAPPFRPKGSS
jgi:phospholipid/cholesterol/gamma-HCH transport system ATP-binding protein